MSSLAGRGSSREYAAAQDHVGTIRRYLVAEFSSKQQANEAWAALDELLEALAGLTWVAERNGLGNDPYVIRANEVLNAAK